jgi:hypothetical protein
MMKRKHEKTYLLIQMNDEEKTLENILTHTDE